MTPCAPRASSPERTERDVDHDSTETHHAGRERQLRRQPRFSAVDVRKSFDDNVVLDGLELTVEEGTVFALLGPNGSGKTTTVNILTTLLAADAGEVRVAGHDVAREPDAVRDAIGLTGQFSAVDDLLTGRENLRLMADLHHLAPADAEGADRRTARSFRAHRRGRPEPVSTYSGGMRRRLDLAMTLIGDPEIIFLDEPTTGLDPSSRRTMWEIVRGLVTRRDDRVPHHAVPGRGGSARRPGGDPRRRPAGRSGHARRAQGARPRRPHRPASSPSRGAYQPPPAS